MSLCDFSLYSSLLRTASFHSRFFAYRSFQVFMYQDNSARSRCASAWSIRSSASSSAEYLCLFFGINESDLEAGIIDRASSVVSALDDSVGSDFDVGIPEGPGDPFATLCASPGNRRKGLLVAENNSGPPASKDTFGLGGGSAGDGVAPVGVPGREIGAGRFNGGGPIGESIEVAFRMNPVDCTPKPKPKPTPVLTRSGSLAPGVPDTDGC